MKWLVDLLQVEIVVVDGVLMDVEGVVFPVKKSSELKGLLVNQLENIF